MIQKVIRLVRHLALSAKGALGAEEYYSRLQRHALVDALSFTEALADHQALQEQRNRYLLF